jgi:peroxiredoxin
VLQPGDRIPDVRVWSAPREDPVALAAAIAGDGLVLLCFYPFDWSPGCTNELLLLRERADELVAAGIRPFGISRDSVWSHAAWAGTMGAESVPLLSDWTGEATRGFDVEFELQGMRDVSARTAFLIEGDTVRASWMLGREMPDIDAIIAAARSLEEG